MTILIADNTGLLDGSLITSCTSGDGRYEAIQYWRGSEWRIYDHRHLGRHIQVYPDAPGMNALVALRRYLVERERDSIGTCDSCGQMMYRDDDYLMQPVTIAGESNAATWQMHRRCAEGED